MRFYVPGVVNTSFADDTVLSAAARNADDHGEKINQALSRLLTFTKISCLSVNVSKIHFILFSQKTLSGDQGAAKVSRGLGLIRRLRNQLPRSALLTLYHSIVMPYISYGCVIWTGGFYTNFKRVQVLHLKLLDY